MLSKMLIERIRKPGDAGYIPPASGAAAFDFLAICRDNRWGMMSCTRERGHDGEHVAHGCDNQELARWSA